MPTPLCEQVVVITGASSGIGRCTAQYFAARGARVVVTARRAEALSLLAQDVEKAGGQALAVRGDVTRAEDLEAVARAAVQRFGRIDTWVNNAGVYRRVLDVNLIGVINGTKSALEVMLPQRSGGMVQVSSVAAKRGVPYTSAYATAKAGIDGFTSSVRAELWGTGVRLSLLSPPPVDTPIYQHGRGKLGVVPKPAPPVADPVEAARAIAYLAETGERTRYFGMARPLALLHALAPAASDWMLHHGAGFTYSDTPAAGDNLEHPSELPPRIRGGRGEPGWKGLTLGEAVRVLPLESLLGAAALGFVAARASARLRAGPPEHRLPRRRELRPRSARWKRRPERRGINMEMDAP